ARLRLRHAFLRIIGEDALDQQTVLRLARNNGFRLDRLFAHVQTQAGLAGVLVRAVAGETVLCQDRPDVAIEFELLPLPVWLRPERHCRQQPSNADRTTATASKQTRIDR